MLKALLLSFLITFSSWAQAGDGEIVGRFRQAAMSAIEEAQGRGFNIVDGINFSDLKKIMKTASINYMENVTLKMESRRCAIWFRQPGVVPSIYLNNECIEIGDLDLKMLALHESLGYAFGADRFYEITSQVFSGLPPINPWLIDFSQNKKDLSGYLASTDKGGSTGVGGGGDIDDLHFKIDGLATLAAIKEDSIHGVPKDLLRYAMIHMNAKPAADIKTAIEMRGSGVENSGQPVVYILSAVYRDRRSPYRAELALLAARVYLLYGSEGMGLVTNPSTVLTYKFESNVIKKPCLSFPSLGLLAVDWKNPKLLQKYSKEEADEICKFAHDQATRLQFGDLKTQSRMESLVHVLLKDY